MLGTEFARAIGAAVRRLNCLGEAAEGLSFRLRKDGRAVRSLAETDHLDATLADRIRGISLDTRLDGGAATIRERLDRDPPGTEDMFYHDLRRHVRDHEMPSELRETDDDTWAWASTDDADQKSAEREQWLANRTWGRAIQIKQDHLRRQGVTGRAHAQAMWDWKDKLERVARDREDPLPFSPEIAGREPRMSEVYRGDRQSREVIFEEGFRSWRDTPDPDRALMDPRPGYDSRIYTAKDLDIAARYPLEDPGKHVYVVEDARNYTDIEDARKYDPHGPRYEAGEAGEVVFRNVPPDKIKGELVDPGDPSAGLIANPNFTPYEPPPIRPPREDGD